MEISQEVQQQQQLQTRDRSVSSLEVTGNAKQPQSSQTGYKWWLRVTVYSLFNVAGLCTGNLLGRLYYDKGGNSKWMATFVQSAGFPILFPLSCFFSTPKLGINNSALAVEETSSAKRSPHLSTLACLYLGFGILLAGDNMMYSYGLLYLPVSTYSLLCATQLAFNALFAFLINSHKFTPYILNSLVLLTLSASLLAINSDSEGSMGLSKGKYAIGFVCTLGASATFSLYLSLVQLSFDRLIKSESFSAVLDMQTYPSAVATCICVVGIFASGDWRMLGREMEEYSLGKTSYVMTLFWTAVAWQVCSIGLLGLVFEASSLFSNVINTLGSPTLPILAVVFFHDKMDGVKVVAMLLAIWGLLSYIYQQYYQEDDSKPRAAMKSSSSA